MPKAPNKPGTNDADGEPRPIEKQPSLENQGETRPDAYPDPARLDDTDRKG